MKGKLFRIGGVVILLLAVGVTMALAITLPAGAASPPLEVNIVAEMYFEPSLSGTFTANGPYVDAGLMCASGKVLGGFEKIVGFQSSREPSLSIQVVHTFTCTDGSGTFDVKLQVRIDHRGDKFNWIIVGGTGDYENLHGAGSGKGEGGMPCGNWEECVLDTYDGKLH